MEIQIIGIPLTFLVLFSIVLWFIILGKGKWWLKAIIVPFVLYFSLVIWFSLGGISGWASASHLPKSFILHWSIIKEPSKKDVHEKGDIFIWASEIDDEHHFINSPVNSYLQPFTSTKNAGDPRSYRLPYSQDLHEKLANAMKSIAKGKTVVGKGGEGEFDAEGDESNAGQGKKGKDGKVGKGKDGGSLSQEQDFMFHELPPPKLPEKITD
jgi:hypothetical protein